MFAVDVIDELKRTRHKSRRAGDELVSEARRILRNDLFAENKILANLKQYRKSFEVIDEEAVDERDVFTLAEIKRVAIRCRLKFLESALYAPEIPYAAIMKIKQLDREHRKELRGFMVLSCPKAFHDRTCEVPSLLFARTNYDNFYLVQRWGGKLHWARPFRFWPLRTFETLVLTVIAFTLAVTMSLPTWLITLDPKAEYWSGYRAAAFFHLLIFNLGFTAYITFAFSKNFSSAVWDSSRDFG